MDWNPFIATHDYILIKTFILKERRKILIKLNHKNAELQRAKETLAPHGSIDNDIEKLEIELNQTRKMLEHLQYTNKKQILGKF